MSDTTQPINLRAGALKVFPGRRLHSLAHEPTFGNLYAQEDVEYRRSLSRLESACHGALLPLTIPLPKEVDGHRLTCAFPVGDGSGDVFVVSTVELQVYRPAMGIVGNEVIVHLAQYAADGMARVASREIVRRDAMHVIPCFLPPPPPNSASDDGTRRLVLFLDRVGIAVFRVARAADGTDFTCEEEAVGPLPFFDNLLRILDFQTDATGAATATRVLVCTQNNVLAIRDVPLPRAPQNGRAALPLPPFRIFHPVPDVCTLQHPARSPHYRNAPVVFGTQCGAGSPYYAGVVFLPDDGSAIEVHDTRDPAAPVVARWDLTAYMRRHGHQGPVRAFDLLWTAPGVLWVLCGNDYDRPTADTFLVPLFVTEVPWRVAIKHGLYGDVSAFADRCRALAGLRLRGAGVDGEQQQRPHQEARQVDGVLGPASLWARLPLELFEYVIEAVWAEVRSTFDDPATGVLP